MGKKLTDKQVAQEWELFLENIRKGSPVDMNETRKEKKERMAWLEKKGNEEEWFKYYFSQASFADAADFQKESSLRFIYTPRLYQRRAWARGLAKSTRRMFEILYMKFVLKWKVVMLMVSKTESNAIRLLAPYRGHLEANARLIYDYGRQTRPGKKWSEEEFITADQCSFRAVGAEQNPRGARLDELRVNIVGFDDVDDDEVCRNIDRLDARWDWIQKAVMPTVEISRDYRYFFDNNIIAEDSIAVRAAQYANDKELVNIRDENGNSTWPEKNSEEDIDEQLEKYSYEAIQTEFYNNPMSAGKTFPDIKYGKCPNMKLLQFAVQYSDPATSNNDKPSVKSKAQNSTKANILMGYLNGTYYIYKAWVDNMTNAQFVDTMYWGREYVNGRCLLFTYVENNSLQDPFFQQVLLPLIYTKGKEYGGVLSVTPDDRKKPEKWFRIEGTLEPLNRQGKLVFNEEEKDDPHMKRLVAQFKNAKATSKTLDGPDATQGGVQIINEKINMAMGGMGTAAQSRSSGKHI